jgi:carbamoylphosphate synthase large subunit
MKKLIRFGEFYHWAAKILEHLDTERYAYEFGPADERRLADVDAYVPLGLDDIRATIALPRALAAKALVPTLEVLELADNKIRFYEYLLAQGYAANVPRIFETPTHYPVVAKLDYGLAGQGVWVVDDAEQWASLLQKHPREKMVLCEYIPGSREYAFQYMARRGEIVWSGLIEHDHSASGDTPYVHGQHRIGGVSRTRAAFAELHVLRSIVQRLEFTGTGCFNFKMLEGTPKIFELNPRPGYSFSYWINQYLGVLLTQLA